MSGFCNKLLRLVSLVAIALFALSFSCLCFEGILWVVAKLTPDKYALIDGHSIMNLLTRVFHTTWTTCAITAVIVITLSYIDERIMLAKASKTDTSE